MITRFIDVIKLKRLISVGIKYINYINKKSLNFKKKNCKKLLIDLSNNQLNESIFAMDSLINFKRPTNLTQKDKFHMHTKGNRMGQL